MFISQPTTANEALTDTTGQPWHPAFDYVPVGMVWLDLSAKILHTNACFRHWTGLHHGSLKNVPDDLQALLGWPLASVWHAHTPAAQPNGYSGDLPAPQFERRGTILSGTQPEQHFRARCYRYIDPTSHQIHITCILEKCPKSDTLQSQLQQATLELNGLFEHVPAGLAHIKGQQLLRTNQRFNRMLGLPLEPARAANTTLQAFAEVPHGLRLLAEAEQALQTQECYDTETYTLLPDGRHVWYAITIHRLPSVGGELEAIAVLHDITSRKLQQLQLEAISRDRELMFNLTGVGIAFVQHGLIQRANRALGLLLGQSDQHLVGQQWATFYAQSGDLSSAEQPEQLALQLPIFATHRDDQDWSAEHALKRADGSRVWVQITHRLINPQTPEAGAILSCVNVDDRHRAEQAVLLQADRTRSILDSVFVGIVTVGERGIEWMNRSARRMFGGELASFFHQPLSTVAPADEHHPFRDTAYLQHLPEGQPYTFECQLMARDGRLFWIVGNAVVTTTSRGRKQITYALLDIERRRQAEVHIAQAQASLQRIIEMAPLAITLSDARTLQVLQMNQVAAAMTQYSRQEAVGKTPHELYDAPVALPMCSDMTQALNSSQLVQREYCLERQGNKQIWDARFIPLNKPGQPSDQLLFVATDVTEQRAAEKARLQDAIAQREMLVREVHHRIKNNLQGVAGLLQQIAAKKPEIASTIGEIVGQVQAIAQVYGLQVGMSGPLKLKRVIEAIAQSVQRTFNRPIHLTVSGETAHDWLLPEAESIPIALCMNELLTNAIKHSQEDTIHCTVQASEQGIKIEIINQGHLPANFSLDHFPGGVSGLGLIRALLPRRSAHFNLIQRYAHVVAIVELSPPGIYRSALNNVTSEPQEKDVQQFALWSQ